MSSQEASQKNRVIDLDVDIGADAVDYKFVFPAPFYRTTMRLNLNPLSAIANQESLSGLETEMRKLEGLVQEIVDEMTYLQRREEKFTNTNGTNSLHIPHTNTDIYPLQNRHGIAYSTLRCLPYSP